MRESGVTQGAVLCLAIILPVTIFAGGVRADPRPYASGPQSGIDWSGFYAGAQIGGGWANVDWAQLNANYFDTLGPTVVGTDTDFRDSGAQGGVLGGYNQQIGQWVFGLELAATATSADVTGARASPFFPTLDNFETELNWLATLAGRVGYAWDRWLVFGRGGWAGGDVKLTLNDQNAAITAAKTTWSNGWTLGAGVEYMLWDCVSVGLAYDYVELDISGESVTCPACGTGVGFGTPIVDSDIRLQSVMARATYYLTPQD